MGSYIDTNRIEISLSTNKSTYGLADTIGYNDIDSELIEFVCNNKKIHTIQISQNLPCEAIEKIDRILEAREDITFRMYSFCFDNYIDLDILKWMPHLKSLSLDSIHLAKCKDKIDLIKLCEIDTIKKLRLSIFDLLDYGFLQELNSDLTELSIFADTMGKSIHFNCEWLLRFPNLDTLYLGKKAKKNIEIISMLSNLNELYLRGIKLSSFHFLQKMNLEKFHLLYCGNNDLSELSELTSLKYLELWRILKLYDISFISSLVNLETIKLMDLRNIRTLPNMDNLVHLKRLIIDNVPINEIELPEKIRHLITNYEY